MSLKSLLLEGLSDATGFVFGSLLGFGLCQLLEWDIFAPGYSYTSILGIVLVGLTGGIGVQFARRWRNRNATDKSKS